MAREIKELIDSNDVKSAVEKYCTASRAAAVLEKEKKKHREVINSYRALTGYPKTLQGDNFFIEVSTRTNSQQLDLELLKERFNLTDNDLKSCMRRATVSEIFTVKEM